MYEDLGAQFHVIERRGILQVSCIRCGKFIGASGSTGPLRVATAAHACAPEEKAQVAVAKKKPTSSA